MALPSAKMVERKTGLEIHVYVLASKEGKESWYLDSQHLLSITFIRETDGQLQLPLYKLVQQPELDIDFLQFFKSISKVKARAEGAIRCVEHSMLQSKALPVPLPTDQGETMDLIEEIPLSVKAPEDYNIIPPMEKDKQVSDQLSIAERQEGWLVEERPRRDGRIDKYYYHIKSNLRFRSLVEVNNFIKYGITPKRSQKANNVKTTNEDSVSLDSKKTRSTPSKRKRTSLSPTNHSKLIKEGIFFPSKETQQIVEKFLKEAHDNLLNIFNGKSKAPRGNRKRKQKETVTNEEEERTMSSANRSSTSISLIPEDEVLVEAPVNFDFDSF